MKYHLLGRSGLRVSELCLGTMTFGEDWGWGAGKEDCRRIFDIYNEQGGNFLDTADGYTNGTSEKMVGEFVHGKRDQYVIATKYTFNQRAGDPNGGGNHRKHMMESVEGSLKRLGTDYIDLYWVHAWDQMTPSDEVMRGLDDLVRQGKILYIGNSDTPAWVVSYSNAIAELRGWTRYVGLQVEYSLIERTPERDLLPMAEALGIGVTAWSPLASGFLTGKYTRENKKSDDGGRLNSVDSFTQPTERNFGIVDAVVSVASAMGVTPAQVAIAWVIRKGAIPIVGARRIPQLEDNLKSVDVVLSEESMKKLDEASAFDVGFPHEFLRRPFVHNFLHGGIQDRLVPRRTNAV